jgi:predicted AlkP superfamily pyrophosphatase or phosphodiesterase
MSMGDICSVSNYSSSITLVTEKDLAKTISYLTMTGLDPVIFLMRNVFGRGMHNYDEYSGIQRLQRPMKPRITINTTKDGEIEIWLNPAGRDVLVRELLALNEKSEHFHFNPEEIKLSGQ